MGEGISCRHCGRQESEHEEPSEEEDANELEAGYECTLLDCRGYEPEDNEVTPIDEVIGEHQRPPLRQISRR